MPNDVQSAPRYPTHDRAPMWIPCWVQCEQNRCFDRLASLSLYSCILISNPVIHVTLLLVDSFESSNKRLFGLIGFSVCGLCYTLRPLASEKLQLFLFIPLLSFFLLTSHFFTLHTETVRITSVLAIPHLNGLLYHRMIALLPNVGLFRWFSNTPYEVNVSSFVLNPRLLTPYFRCICGVNPSATAQTCRNNLHERIPWQIAKLKLYKRKTLINCEINSRFEMKC